MTIAPAVVEPIPDRVLDATPCFAAAAFDATRAVLRAPHRTEVHPMHDRDA